MRDDGFTRDTGVQMLAGTSPVMTILGGDGFEEDIQAPSRDLVKVVAGHPGQDTSVLMAAGTNAATAITFPVRSIVPDVMGMDQDIAEGWITDAGLTVGTITLNNQCKDVKGAVLTQDPSTTTTPPLPSRRAHRST